MRRCGLLGKVLGHSYSPDIHRTFGEYEYRLYEKSEEELEDFIRNGSWDGLNVTIPYKKEVLRYCTEISENAKQIGSVNTLVKKSDGSIFGENTDYYGFSDLLVHSKISAENAKVLVLGSGGASVSVTKVLQDHGASVIVISRNGPDHYGNLEKHADAEMIVNTTPVGMYPDNGRSPIELKRFPKCRAVFDIIYNPERTELLLQAEELQIPAFGGLEMLVSQAAKSSELFIGKAVSANLIRQTEETLKKKMRNIVLIGMPGCGKSTAAKLLGEKTGREVLDTDRIIEEMIHQTAGEYIEKNGEAAFRKLEHQVICEAGKLSGKIISTGGGCVTFPDNYRKLHQNGTIVWIKRDIKKLPVGGRPLSARIGTEELYALRRPLYESFADLTVENDAEPERLLLGNTFTF